MAKLTHQQKLDALSYRFYQNGQWTPKAGDFYTTSRADLELYQVVSVEGGIVRTRYTEGSAAISEWQEAGFLTEGFGPKRVLVPEWVICAPEPPKDNMPVRGTPEYAAAEAAFVEYFVRNYPGPDTIIHDPKWHAPKLFAVAVRAVREAQ